MQLLWSFFADAVRHAASGRLDVQGMGLDTVACAQFPASLPSIVLVCRVDMTPEETCSRHSLRVEVAKGNARPLLELPEFQFSPQPHSADRDRYRGTDLAVEIGPMVFAAPGDYSFHIMIDNQELGLTHLRITETPDLTALRGPTLKIDRISLCDSFALAQFNKLVLQGYSYLSNTLNIDSLPYVLQTNILLEGEICVGEEIPLLSLGIRYFGRSGNLIAEEVHPLAPQWEHSQEKQSGVVPIIIPIRFSYCLTEYGKLEFHLTLNDQTAYLKSIDIMPGRAPNVKVVGEPRTLSGLLFGDSRKYWALMGMVSRELVLVDAYLSPDFLNQVLRAIPQTASVRVLIGPKAKARYRQLSGSLPASRQAVEVRCSENLHDRFIIVDGTECFHFGYSFKDLDQPKASWFHKIYANDEVDALLNWLGQEWAGARTVL